MFQINNKEFRNLEEQVQKNKDDIQRHYEMTRVLDDFGIRVIGRLDTKEELDAVPTDNLQYGDAYAIGAEPPYTFYIWTRANNDSESDYWFNMGELAISGPVGPAGAYVTGITINPSTYYPTFTFSNGNTITVPTSIRGSRGPVGPRGESIVGPRGAVGPRGETGPRGEIGPQGKPGSFNILGTIYLPDGADIFDYLPHATTMDMGAAYIVFKEGITHLYTITGESQDQFIWQDTGVLTAEPFTVIVVPALNTPVSCQMN